MLAEAVAFCVVARHGSGMQRGGVGCHVSHPRRFDVALTQDQCRSAAGARFNAGTHLQKIREHISKPRRQGLVGPEAQEEAAAAPPLRENTSPTFPSRADIGATGLDGIETPRTADNTATTTT